MPASFLGRPTAGAEARLLSAVLPVNMNDSVAASGAREARATSSSRIKACPATPGMFEGFDLTNQKGVLGLGVRRQGRCSRSR